MTSALPAVRRAARFVRSRSSRYNAGDHEGRGAFDEALTEFDLAVSTLPGRRRANARLVMPNVVGCRLRGRLCRRAAAYESAAHSGTNPAGAGTLVAAQGRTAAAGSPRAAAISETGTPCIYPAPTCRGRRPSPRDLPDAPRPSPRTRAIATSFGARRAARAARGRPDSALHGRPRAFATTTRERACWRGWVPGTTPHAADACSGEPFGRLATIVAAPSYCRAARPRDLGATAEHDPPRSSGPPCVRVDRARGGSSTRRRRKTNRGDAVTWCQREDVGRHLATSSQDRRFDADRRRRIRLQHQSSAVATIRLASARSDWVIRSAGPAAYIASRPPKLLPSCRRGSPSSTALRRGVVAGGARLSSPGVLPAHARTDPEHRDTPFLVASVRQG